MTPAIEAFRTIDDWATECRIRIETSLRDAMKQNGWARFAGSGGSTPTPIYERLAKADLDWQHVFVTLVDERYVPESSPESNAALLKSTLLCGPAKQAVFLPLYRPSVTVDRSAALAAHELREEMPHFDAVLLGMGEDGHICSMFPNSPTLKTLLTPTLKPTVLGVPPGRDGAAPTIERLSVNLPYLIKAGRVILALKGAAKREVYEREAEGDPKVQPIAALLAHDVPLEVVWTEAP